MNNLRIEYKNLITKKFNICQIKQLMFLYDFLYKKNQISRYKKFVNEIDNNYSAKYLEQLIKCITHNTPYELFLNNRISISSLNELRRYLEDSIKNNNLNNSDDKMFYSIAEIMVKKNGILI